MKRRNLLKAAIGIVLAPLAICRGGFGATAPGQPREWIEEVGELRSLTIGGKEIVAVRGDMIHGSGFRCRQIRTGWVEGRAVWRCSNYPDQPVSASLVCVDSGMVALSSICLKRR